MDSQAGCPRERRRFTVSTMPTQMKGRAMASMVAANLVSEIKKAKEMVGRNGECQ